MSAFNSKCLFYVFMVLPLWIACCGDTPLEHYQPRSQKEKDIVSVLVQYQEARNRFDVEGLLSLLHDRGEFTFQCGMMVSKDKLKEMLPGFWAKLKSGDSAVIPLVHECINGDYFPAGRLNNLQVEIHGDQAQAAVLFTKGVCRVMLYATMRREDDRWLIARTEWGES